MSIPSESELPPSEIQRLQGHRASLIASFGYAFNGLLRTLCTQRNMKIHWVSAVAVMLVGMALPLDLAARASVMFCVAMVLCMEVLNTALEAFVDLHIRQFARTAMIAKDAAAASVLILAIGATVVFADILFHNWRMVFRSAEAISRTVLAGVPLLAVVAAGLWMRRRLSTLVLLLIVAILLTGYLAYHSRDEVFSSGALGFVILGFVARLREPRLLIRP